MINIGVHIVLVSVSGNVVDISVCNAYPMIELTKHYYAGWYKMNHLQFVQIIHQVSIVYSTKWHVSAVPTTLKVRTCGDGKS